MKHEHIILMSTHILQLATDISDEIVLLKNGKLVDSAWNKDSSEAFESQLMASLEEEGPI